MAGNLAEEDVPTEPLFIQSLGRTAAAGRTPMQTGARLSISQMTTFRWSFPEDVLGYLRCGIEAIGVWRPKLAEFGEERGIELIRESGLSVSTLSLAGGFTGSHGFSYIEAVEDTREALHLAGALGAEALVIVSGARAGHTTRHARRLVRDALLELADEAAERDVTLALLPMHPFFARSWTFLNGLDQTLDLLGECRHPHVGLAFDAYHLWQEPRLLERIPEIAGQVAAVQLSDGDGPPRSESDRRLPGRGRIPLGAIVQAFLASGYNGCFDVQVWSEETWQSDYLDVVEFCRAAFLSQVTRATAYFT